MLQLLFLAQYDVTDLAVIKLPSQLQTFCLVNVLIGRSSLMEKGWETLVWLLFETIGLCLISWRALPYYQLYHVACNVL